MGTNGHHLFNNVLISDLEYKDSGALVACQFLQTDLLILTDPIMDFSKL
jgi:hypothetical protein